MANRVEIFVDVDPTGRGAAAIRGIRADVRGLERDTNRAGTAGREALSGFAGGLGIPISVGAATAAIGAGIAAVGHNAIEASNQGANAQRILRSEAQSTGVAFQDAERNAEAFARQLGISLSDAERNTGKFYRLAKAAGELPNFERHITNLENLTAAYSLTSEEVTNLTQQLLSGQDEALNRLGIADPSQLYKKYAAAIGTAVERLTDEEKVRARLLAVSEKGAQFEGAAEERLRSQQGLWMQLSASIADASRSLGDYLQRQTFIGDIPGLLTGQTPDEVLQKRFDAQQRAAEAEARRRADELEAFGDLAHRQAQLAKDPSRKFESFDFLAASISLTPAKEEEIRKQAARAAEIARDEMARIVEGDAKEAEEKALARLANAPSTPEGDKLRNQAKAEARARVEAERQARVDVAGDLTGLAVERHARLEAIRGEATAQRDAFEKQYRELFTDKELDLVTLGFAEQQFQHIKGIFSDEKQAEITKGLAKLYKAFQKEAATYLKGVRAEAEGLFDTLAQRYAGEADNPFVKILTDADESARKLQKTFGILGEAVVNELQGVEAAYYRQQTLAASLDATLKATSLFRQADAFLNPRGLSGQEEAAIAVLERRLDLLKTRVDVTFKIAAISGGLTPDGLQGALDRNKEGLLGQEFRGLQGLLNNVRGRGAGDQEQRARIYERIAAIFEELSPTTQRRISNGDIAGKDVFLAAYQGIKDRQERRLKEELDKARYLDEQVDSAREDLDYIRRAREGGLDTSEADRRLLARLKELPENLLTPDLRGEGFDAASREAERQLLQQDRATQAVERSRESTDKLTEATDNLAKAIQDPRQRELLIRILNKSKADVRDDMYGSLQPLPPSPDSQ